MHHPPRHQTLPPGGQPLEPGAGDITRYRHWGQGGFKLVDVVSSLLPCTYDIFLLWGVLVTFEGGCEVVVLLQTVSPVHL